MYLTLEKEWHYREARRGKESLPHTRSTGCVPQGGKRFFKETPGQTSGIILRPKDRYQFVDKLGGRYGVVQICTLAGVSSSGYYKWKKRKDIIPKDQEDVLLVQEIFLKGKKKWGWRRIRMELEGRDIIMNHKKIQRIMRQNDFITAIRRKNPYRMIAKKGLEHRTAPNILNREFGGSVPYRALCTDITYLWWKRRFVYLSTVKDVCSGEIVAWELDRSLHLPLVLKTIEQLQRRGLEGSIIHSDQGWHYTHPDYIRKVSGLQMIQSMSRKGNCIDNAPMESFFGHFKDEIDLQDCLSFGGLKECVDQYMHYYNHGRPQWTRNKMTPIQYRSHVLSLE